MISDGFWAFIALSVIMEITPGPNMGYLAIVSLTRGRQAGMAGVVGTAAGLLVVGMLGALGAAAIVAESPVLYQILRWGGVAFLFWLAWDGWRDAGVDIASAPAHMDGKYALRGLVTNLLNPKAFLFYVSVLPNFIDPGSSIIVSGLTLTVIYVAIATAAHTTIVLAASSMRRFLNSPAVVRTISRGLSLLLIGIALWLLWETKL